jgi:hypothetical protein
MIIGIGGKKFSGKTTLAQTFIDHGYQKASFATSLKEYVGELYGWTQEQLNTPEGKESLLDYPVAWDEPTCDRLSQIIGLEILGSNIVFTGKSTFKTRREALEYIGTDVLRQHDEGFHIKEFKRRFANGLYVCDDLRFPNELEVLKQINGYCVYLIRPRIQLSSNHASENSLSASDFENVLMNDGTKEELYKKGERILSDLHASVVD